MEPHGGHHLIAPAPVRHQDDLHLCPRCSSDLVQPEWWDEADGGSWQVGLRCPECEHRHEGVYRQSVVDAYDEFLNESSDELAASYRRLVRENLSDELERFAGALNAGAILPEDF
jgi:hypothetical protein